MWIPDVENGALDLHFYQFHLEAWFKTSSSTAKLSEKGVITQPGFSLQMEQGKVLGHTWEHYRWNASRRTTSDPRHASVQR